MMTISHISLATRRFTTVLLIVTFLFTCSDLAPVSHARQSSAAPLTLRATLRDYRGPSQSKSQPALLVFSPDDGTVAYRSDERSVTLASAATGERRALLTVEKGVLDAFSFSPDGSLAATRYIPDKQVLIWDAASGKLQRTLGGIEEAGRLRKNRGTATVMFRKELMPVPFSPDGRLIVNEQPEDITAVWNVATGATEKRFDRNTQLSGARHAAKTILLAFLTGGLPFVGGTDSAMWNADGKFVITLDRDRTPKLWDVTTGKMHAALIAPGEKVVGVFPSPDGRFVATIDGDGELKLWSVSTGEQLTIIERKGIAGAAWSSDGDTLVFGRFDKDVQLYDVPTRRVRVTLPDSRLQLTGGRDPLDSRGGPQFSPDGRTLATGGSKRQAAMVWDVATGKLLYALPKGEDDTQSLAWSPDGRMLVTANDDAMTMWDAASGKLLQKLGNGARSPARFSRDGRTLATGARNDTALLWNVSAMPSQIESADAGR